jgi:YD repeat-containing protein
LASYDGCGCAGGQVTTIKEENIVETDWQGQNPNTLGRRTQKNYEDILGRTYKTEVLNWDAITPYNTTVVKFNGRDQATSVRQYDGAETSQIFQESVQTYDGHGRLKTRHRPVQQNSNGSVAYSTYNYNADDSISSMVDARGANTNFAYNSRGLVEQISYGVPTGSTIQVSPTVGLIYDNIGNRTQMTDGLGTISYQYNQLSQMTSETRQFTDSLPNAPLSNNSFKLEYDYTLAGQLKSLKDPFGQQFNYAYDKVGRLQQVTGATAFQGISNYADTPTYNARGVLTGLHYGNQTEMAITGFNNKLQPTNFEVKKGAASYLKKQYQFYADGSLKFSKDELDGKFDRLYKYDQVGRTTEAKSGMEARGATATNTDLINIPYKFQYQYNAFGQITHSLGRYYNSYSPNNYSFNNSTGRNPNWIYDAEGNTVSDDDAVYQFDAAGANFSTADHDEATWEPINPTVSTFDGGGQPVKRIRSYSATTNNTLLTNYYIRSSVLGKVITETDGTGKKLKTFVPANGATLAEQELVTVNNTTTENLNFIHQDASGESVQQTKANGDLTQTYARTGEYDALGRNVADVGNFITLNGEPPPDTYGSGIDLFGSEAGYRPGQNTYRMDGLPISQSQFMLEINSGRIGGAFGVLFASARLSAHPQEIGRWRRTVSWNETSGGDTGEFSSATQTTRRSISFEMGIVYDNSWSVSLSLISIFVQTNKLSPEKQKILTDAVTESFNRLKKSKCYKALGFKSLKEVTAFFKKNHFFSFNELPVESKTNPELYTNTVAITNNDGNIAINNYGDFYSDSSGFVEGPGKKKYQLDGARTPYTKKYKDAIFSFANDNLYRVLILLHEISHSRGVAGNDGPATPNYQDKQAENNDRVLENCFKSKTQGAGAGAGITSTIFK